MRGSETGRSGLDSPRLAQSGCVVVRSDWFWLWPDWLKAGLTASTPPACVVQSGHGGTPLDR